MAPRVLPPGQAHNRRYARLHKAVTSNARAALDPVIMIRVPMPPKRVGFWRGHSSAPPAAATGALSAVRHSFAPWSWSAARWEEVPLPCPAAGAIAEPAMHHLRSTSPAVSRAAWLPPNLLPGFEPVVQARESA